MTFADEFAYDGQSMLTRGDGTTLIMGPRQPNPYRIEKASYFGAADQHNADQLSPGRGEIAGMDFEGGRMMTQSITLTAWPNKGQCVLDREALEAAWQTGTDEATLAWQEGGLQRLRFGRCRGVEATNRLMTYKDIVTTFRATDPRSYDVEETLTTIDDLQLVTNDGPMRTIAWRVVVPGPFTGGRLFYNTEPTVANSFNVPDVADGYELSIDARRGEVRVTNIAVETWVAVTGQCTTDLGNVSRFMTMPAASGTFFGWTVSTGTATADVYVRGCYP